MTHTCKICGVTSDVAEFYERVNSRCKECHKAKARENRAAKADYYKAYDARRYQEDPKVRARHRRYQKTEAGKKSLKKAKEKWLKCFPERRAAHVLLNNALRYGKVTKSKVCEVCGASGRIEGHHEDYTKPLDVKWLCKKCHVEKHRNDEK
jgi:hypothetical protein